MIAAIRAARRGTQPVIDPIAMQIRAAAIARRDAVAEHATIASKSSRCRSRYGHACAAHLKQLVLVPIFAGDRGHDLLRQNIERRHRHLDAIEPALPHGAHQRQRFQQFVARQREQPALGNAPQRMPGPADPLQKRGDRTRRADLAHQVDVADVDAQLQRRRGHDRLQLARS